MSRYLGPWYKDMIYIAMESFTVTTQEGDDVDFVEDQPYLCGGSGKGWVDFTIDGDIHTIDHSLLEGKLIPEI